MKREAESEIRGMDKEQLRLSMQKRLLAMPAGQRAEKSRKACQNLISTEQFQRATVIMMYLSLPHEADISEAILSAWQLGKTVSVPKVSWQQRHMIPVEITSLETGFSTEVAGLRNPVTGVPIPFEGIDLVVAPALAFDKSGNRLGRGGSYYDRFFANKELVSQKCGFGLEEQLLESLPVGPGDIPVDFLVTDEQVLYFSSQPLGKEQKITKK